MPLTAVVKLGTNQSLGNATIAVSPSRDILAGEFVVVTLSERNWNDNAATTLADNSSQTGTANSYTQDRLNNLQSDSYTYIYSCKLTRKILSTNSITATFAGGSGGKSMVVYVLPDANASSQVDLLIRAGGGGASTYDTGATSNASQADEYFVGVAAFSESNFEPGTITANSPWTLQFSGDAGGGQGYGHAHGTQIISSITTLQFSGSWGVSQDGVWTASGVSYKGTASGIIKGPKLFGGIS